MSDKKTKVITIWGDNSYYYWMDDNGFYGCFHRLSTTMNDIKDGKHSTKYLYHDLADFIQCADVLWDISPNSSKVTKKCTCGAAKTSNPNLHSYWCDSL